MEESRDQDGVWENVVPGNCSPGHWRTDVGGEA